MIRINREATTEAEYRAFVNTLQNTGFSIDAYISTLEGLVEAGYVQKQVEAMGTTFTLTELGVDLLKERLPEEWDRKMEEVISETLQQELERVRALHVLAQYGGMIIEIEGEKMRSIKGVDNFDNSDSSLSHLCAIACVLTYYGEKVDWDWLMGTSGEAFCYYYHPDGTFLSQFVHSYDIANAALGAYGYAGKWRFEHSDNITPALTTIESEITHGRLVIAPGMMPGPDGITSACHYWFVVTGIDRDAQKVRLLGAEEKEVEVPLPIGDSNKPRRHPRWYGIARSFKGIDGHYGPIGADNPVLLVDRMRQPVEQKDVVLKSLRQAISLAREESVFCSGGYGAGTYLSGLTALQRLRDDLLAAKGDELDEYERLNKPKSDPFRGLGDELEFLKLLSWRRRSAANFLTQVVPLLPEAARPHLTVASKHFKDSATEAIKAFNIRYGSEKEHARIHELIREGKHGDDNPEWVTYWKRADEALASRNKRKAMADHLTRVLEFEKMAIAELEKALATANSWPAIRRGWKIGLQEKPLNFFPSNNS